MSDPDRIGWKAAEEIQERIKTVLSFLSEGSASGDFLGRAYVECLSVYVARAAEPKPAPAPRWVYWRDTDSNEACLSV